jgi:N-acetyl-D-muramate 6-phosphate phosphatase
MAIDLQRVRGLLFDVDGTLCDTDNHYVSRVMQWMPSILGEHRKRLARRLVMAAESPGNLVFSLLDELGLDAPLIGLIDRINRSKGAQRPMRMVPVPGVPRMLKALQGRYAMAVVSARPEPVVHAFLDHHGLRDYFAAVASALTCPRTKPYPDQVLWAAERLNLAPGQCIMIGDTTVDIRAGKAARAQTIGVLCGFGEERELRRYGADAILPSTAELDEFLSRANRAAASR